MNYGVGRNDSLSREKGEGKGTKRGHGRWVRGHEQLNAKGKDRVMTSEVGSSGDSLI